MLVLLPTLLVLLLLVLWCYFETAQFWHQEKLKSSPVRGKSRRARNNNHSNDNDNNNDDNDNNGCNDNDNDDNKNNDKNSVVFSFSHQSKKKLSR